MGNNNFESRTKDSFKGLIGFFKSIGLIIFTLGVWSWIIGAFIWILGAFGWFLLAYVWRKNLFIPQAVYSTALAFLLSVGWAVIIWIIMFMWTQYHYYRYYKKNKRKLKMPAFEAPILAWKELSLETLDTAKITENKQIRQETNETPFGNFASIKEEDYLISFPPLTMKKNFCTPKGNIIVSEGEEITPEVIKRIEEEGLYWEFIHEISEYIPKEEESK
ncbi:hypothetical protein TKV_c10580 [Thermoanaerobacter kivui]|uniref:Uncharacterized protein n=1 Tax=Thermoanaerobacter kivui TaxID=2325 RepID=A0A097AR15_THEKI|nr:hypothetical protein [Thermoanaerobacter kivui]AIS52233.1 hypothetical protein TKV_c10580 [Thermoanaerobacter kivui]